MLVIKERYASMKSARSLVLTLLSLFFFFTTALQAYNQPPKCDLVIFTYNRPLQLYAFLESIEKYVTGIDSTLIIYRSSTPDYIQAYDKVFKRFSWAQCITQGERPYEDFKPLTLKAIYESKQDYFAFGVDDIVVKDFVNLSECITALETTGAYGFYLPLGKHLTDCYMVNKPQQVPPLHEVLPRDLYLELPRRRI